MAYQGTIFECAWCGERKTSKSMYCRYCATPTAREKVFKENQAIWQENEKLGFKNPLDKKIFPFTPGMPNCFEKLTN